MPKRQKSSSVLLLVLLAQCISSSVHAQTQSDAAKKAEFMSKAQKGDSTAQFLLGFRSEYEQDYTQAADWYRKAAEQGNVEAQFSLGILYGTGQGVPQDDSQAVMLFRKAAEQGLARAQSNLGVAYASGRGIPKDVAEAAAWWRKAAEQGDEQAQFKLGLCYFTGQGVLEDYVEAHKWLNIAASHASADDQKQFMDQRNDVGEALSPAQLAEAQRRASDWLAAFEKRKKK
jgi:uncharacterized protein